MKTVIKIKSLVLMLLGVCMLTACSSKEDELVGSWTRSVGIGDGSYTELRCLHKNDTHPTYLHTFKFAKGENGKAAFEDSVWPLLIDPKPDDVMVGTKVTGNWEIKDGKLYLYYNDEVELLNSDNLDPQVAEVYKEALKKQFVDVYNEKGSDGFPYEFIEKNDKRFVEIQFGNDALVFHEKKKTEE